ncbi:hypothetical protein Egran_01717 [Elaphomyces granulatus]|uniref:N-acetyltransferase domain-containing protein n=1 Tax=Elaphomyces granulatus TaxID=519963 RepID=A0A232M2C7_9EURO|nr:hypothetical protein Egran_01717 [Elaphomyces granulatus]
MVEETDTPPLMTYVAVREAEQIDALRLIADNVAQQRQTASCAIISHPVVIAILAIISLTNARIYRVRGADGDMGVVAYREGENRSNRHRAAATRSSSRRNQNHSDKESDNDNGSTNREDQEPIDREYEDDQDTIIVTRYGGQIIGALVLRSPPVSSPSTLPASASMSQGSSANDSNKKATIRAWTVRMRYRKKGIGTGLLEAAVSQCRLRGWVCRATCEFGTVGTALVPRFV